MSTRKPTLDDLRRQIDEIDDAIHDLIMRRAEVGRTIGTVKDGDGIRMRPGREAQILRRLVARHRGEFPRPVLVRIWREIVSAFTALQGPFSVAASATQEGPDLARLAREHFGSQTPVKALESNMSVLRAVSEGEASVGVLPLPRSEEADPWWRRLARDGDSVPRIVARLPFIAVPPDRPDEQIGLAIALAEPEDSGEDRAFVVIETAQQLSRSSIGKRMRTAGFGVADIQTWVEAPERRLHLIEVEGHVVAGDARLRRLVEESEGAVGHCWGIGGYPVPLTAAQLGLETGRGRGR